MTLPELTLDDLEAEPAVILDEFTNDDAVRLGLTGLEIIRERGLSLAVDIVIGDYLTFRARTGETGADNDVWLAGKARVVRHYGAASLLVRRRLEAASRTVTDDGLDEALYKAHGGCIPIFVGGQVYATITMSGEPDVVDHATASETISRYLAS